MSEQIEMILNSKKINYDRLARIIPQYIQRDTKEYDTVNVFIDIYDIVKKLYSPLVLESLSGRNKSMDMRLITSELINVIGHYRHYFASRLYKYTNFYILYTEQKSRYHTSLKEDYRFEFYEKRLSKNVVNCNQINSLLRKNIKLTKMIIDRIPNCCFIDSGSIEYSFIPFMLMSEKLIDTDIPSVIISNDTMFLQDTLLNDNIMVLITASQNSRMITIDNVYDELISNLKNIPEFSFSQNLLPILMSLSGNKNYGITGVNRMSYGRSIGLLNKMINNGDIVDYPYTSEESYGQVLDKTNLIKDEHKEHAMLNFKLMNHFAQNKLCYNKKEYNNIMSQLLRVTMNVTAKEIKAINNRYFHENPILFDFCFEGEDI